MRKMLKSYLLLIVVYIILAYLDFYGVVLVADEAQEFIQNFVPDHRVQAGGGLVQNEQPGGENGAGKTTTIKCILNLIRRDAGEITLLGYDNISEERLAKQNIGLVLDECFFHDTLRPLDVGKILAPAYREGGQHHLGLVDVRHKEGKLQQIRPDPHAAGAYSGLGGDKGHLR
mgnify:CR=1 FL=1